MSSKNGTKKVLTKEDIFSVPLQIQEVDVPEWGGIVYVKEMTALQIEQNAQAVIKNNGDTDYNKAVKLPVIHCIRQVVDADGNRLFSEADTKKLSGKQGGAIRRVAKAVQELSGQGGKDNDAIVKWLKEERPDILKEYEEETGAVVEAEENFTETP